MNAAPQILPGIARDSLSVCIRAFFAVEVIEEIMVGDELLWLPPADVDAQRVRVVGLDWERNRLLVARVGAAEGAMFSIKPEARAAWRGGERIGLPKAFTSRVQRIEAPMNGSLGWIEIEQPGHFPIAFNATSRGWPTFPVSAGNMVRVVPTMNDLHAEWSVQPLN